MEGPMEGAMGLDGVAAGAEGGEAISGAAIPAVAPRQGVPMGRKNHESMAMSMPKAIADPWIFMAQA